SQQDNLSDWIEKSAQYLSAFLDQESLGLVTTCGCGTCNDVLHRCITCSPMPNSCLDCIKIRHQFNPFHRILKWNGLCFEGIELSELGISLSVRHLDGRDCSKPRDYGIITVIDVNGFHEICVNSCGCGDGDSIDLQLFSLRLFPASTLMPKTAITFELLEQFRLIHLEAKTSAHSFMQALIRLTTDEYFDAWPTRDRTREFQRVARQWNFLLASRNALLTEASTKLLVPLCPACPQPGLNIDDESVARIPPEKCWLARQYIHFDANFRLVLEKRVPQSFKGPGLWEKRGFFVASDPYTQYLRKMDTVQQQPVSTCSDYRAMSSFSRSRFQSLDVTGIAGAVCRHECALPGSFVNLFKGERFVNSDYAILNLLSKLGGPHEKVITYDIACQYSKKFFSRIEPAAPYVPLPTTIPRFLVPKFHLAAHQDKCRYKYSLNHCRGVGRTDGEAIERFWSTHNHLSGSTSKMTSGFRLDTLELHFSDWNKRKIWKMGVDLKTRLIKAHQQAVIHNKQFNELCSELPKEKTDKWIALEKQFEASMGEENPYEAKNHKVPSKETIIARLNVMENGGASYGDSVEGSSAAKWINEGLEIEDNQERIRTKRKTVNSGSMEREHVLLAEECISLWEWIVKWRMHSPFAPSDMENDSPSDIPDAPDFPEDEAVILPSSMSELGGLRELANLELQLREGQANEALKTIRECLSQRLVLIRKKKADHDKVSTRQASSAYDRLTAQMNQAAVVYRKAYNAMIKLGMNIDHPVYRPLHAQDLGVGDIFNTNRTLGQGYKPNAPWIWYTSGVFSSNSLAQSWLEEVVRVQFLESKVNRDRWNEEVELLETELKRTRTYFATISQEWAKRAKSVTGGCAAYCYRMAGTYHLLGTNVQKLISP
ncbi:hypothetical protein CPB86DRAFT_719431, partial [Serendipita vermifera]